MIPRSSVTTGTIVLHTDPDQTIGLSTDGFESADDFRVDRRLSRRPTAPSPTVTNVSSDNSRVERQTARSTTLVSTDETRVDRRFSSRPTTLISVTHSCVERRLSCRPTLSCRPANLMSVYDSRID